MQTVSFFPSTKTSDGFCRVFAADTRHPGVIHARVIRLLSDGLLDEAIELVDSRLDSVKPGTLKVLDRYLSECTARAV